MLKTNSKQARENIRNYIINRFDCSDYSPEKRTRRLYGNCKIHS